jgi:hypothetical protein
VINPKTILGEWVTALQSCPDLVTAIGGDADNIRAFMEGLATTTISGWPSPDAARLDPGCVERHDAAAAHRRCAALRASLLDLPARAEQNSTATYADLFWLLVSAIPTGAPSWSSLLHFQIDPDCYPMDMDLPSAQRNTVVVSADGATLDYFEVQATLVEQGNPGGE